MLKRIKNQQFNAYLAGLLEGDGSFVVPRRQRDLKGRRRYAKIKVAFVSKDRPLAEVLKFFYGGHFEEHENYIVWSITCRDQILQICYDINGYLRTPKFNDFAKLIHFIKTQSEDIQFDILPLDDSSCIGSNAWLAGFIDADGNFHISITNRKNSKKRVQLQFRLEVKENYGKEPLVNSENFSSFVPICNTVACYFGLGVYHRTRLKKYHLIIISSTSRLANAKVVDYFERFSLLSSKRLDYENWKTIHNLQIKTPSLTQENLKMCERIQKNHNSNRHITNWDHLTDLYSELNKK